MAALESEGWVRAWHGTKLEALYSQTNFGRLFSSSIVRQGERFFTGSPGVYLHKDSTKHKAEHYMRFVQLPSLQFYSVKWEVRTHRNFRVTVARQTDQWVQQPNSVVLAALWVCSCHHSEMIGGSSVSPAWHPLLESNPFWPQAAERVAQEDVELHPVDTQDAHRPRQLPMTNSSSSAPSLSCQAAAGSFEWHFGEHGQAMPQVRQLYKEACLAMSNVKLINPAVDL